MTTATDMPVVQTGGPPSPDYRPMMLLAIAAMLAMVAAATRFGQWIDPSAGQWVFNIFGKVAILTGALALAWRPLKRLSASPSGRVVLGGMVVAGGFFIIRPRSLLAVGPLILIAIVVLVGLSWAKNFFAK